jgi:serine/threonine protein kinase
LECRGNGLHALEWYKTILGKDKVRRIVLTHRERFVETPFFFAVNPASIEIRNIVTKQILSANYNFDADVWKDRSREGKQFVSSLLELDQQKRLSAEQALRHPWFSSKANMSKRKPDPLAMRCAQARLVQYAESGEFRRVVMNVVAKKATTEDILELREIFNEYDSNHDGMISFKEWKRALARSNLSDEVVQSIFRKLVSRTVLFDFTYVSRTLVSPHYTIHDDPLFPKRM